MNYSKKKIITTGWVLLSKQLPIVIFPVKINYLNDFFFFSYYWNYSNEKIIQNLLFQNYLNEKLFEIYYFEIIRMKKLFEIYYFEIIWMKKIIQNLSFRNYSKFIISKLFEWKNYSKFIISKLFEWRASTGNICVRLSNVKKKVLFHPVID